MSLILISCLCNCHPIQGRSINDLFRTQGCNELYLTGPHGFLCVDYIGRKLLLNVFEPLLETIPQQFINRGLHSFTKTYVSRYRRLGVLPNLGIPFGTVLGVTFEQLTLEAHDVDICIGDILYIESWQGCRDKKVPRYFLFRVLEYNHKYLIDSLTANTDEDFQAYSNADLATKESQKTFLDLQGQWLGYGHWQQDHWQLKRPRKLPGLFSKVFQVDYKNVVFLTELLKKPLQGELYIGDLLIGDKSIEQISVSLTIDAVLNHIGIWGCSDSEKSNLILVLLRAIFEHNRLVIQGERNTRRVSAFVVDPQNELATQQAGTDELLASYATTTSSEVMQDLVGNGCYLSPTEGTCSYGQVVKLSTADVIPSDLSSVMNVNESQLNLMWALTRRYGDQWISRVYNLGDAVKSEVGGQPSYVTIHSVMRQMEHFFNSRLFKSMDLNNPLELLPYESNLLNIIESIECGRIQVIDSSLLDRVDQCLVITVVGRVLLSLRKAVKASLTLTDLRRNILNHLGVKVSSSLSGEEWYGGMQAFARCLWEAIQEGRIPYLDGERVRPLDELPVVCLSIDDASSVLNAEQMKFGSIFRDISHQGHKFGIGLLLISQQVSHIDKEILTQIDTKLMMSLGNKSAKDMAIKNSSLDLSGFHQELTVLERRQVLMVGNYQDFGITVKIPEFIL